MSNNVSIHFKCQGRMYSILLKNSVEEITLSMVEARIYKKLALDESEVKLQFSYIPLLVRCEEEQAICDDEDMYVYLTSIDNENRRCVLFVEVITTSGLPEQLSRAGKSSFGMNYEKATDDEIGAKAITLHVEKEQGKQVEMEVDDGDDGDDDDDDDVSNSKEGGNVRSDEVMSDGAICSSDRDMADQYFEPPPVVEVSKLVIEPWEDGLGLSVLDEFPNKKALEAVVCKASFKNSFSFVIKRSDRSRLVLQCTKKMCKWSLRASRIAKTDIFSVRKYTNMHTCSRATQSTSNNSSMKRHGSPELVAALLHEDYPGQMETPSPKIIMDLVKTKLGVTISYSTALRGKNLAVSDLRGNPEESYKMLYCYLHMLEKVNDGTKTYVHLDKDSSKFMYLFIALGASIEGFKFMRKVIVVDATFLKNGYGGVLVFASAQDPNRHHYPIAFGVLDGEKDASWTWFMEMLKTVVPDSSELVFMSDRNARLIGAIENVYPKAHHGFCIWHLSQNVKGYASNVNKDVVAWRFMELSRQYTVADFNAAYFSFKMRYPSAAKYLEETTKKEKWARCWFPGERYNLDTSNCVESLNSVFKDARKYSLIPMLDAIIKTFSRWFNEHRKEAVAGSIEHKLVPFVENCMHDLWVVAEKLSVTELNIFELEYHVIGSDGKPYLVNLLSKTCSCKVFDIEWYPCVHGLAAYIEFLRHEDRGRDIQLHELCAEYYLSDWWAEAYKKTIYIVSDRSQWDVPDDVKSKQIIPPDPKNKKGRKKVKRFPSTGERRPGRRPRTKNKRRPREKLQWLLFGTRFGGQEKNS